MSKQSDLDSEEKKLLKLTANAIRALAMDAVEKAESGHAGTPMGLAEIGAYLYGEFLNVNPVDGYWINRDRFILSAGHASMLQYALLHFFGVLSINDLENFRQLDSKTPSHPQYNPDQGIETTTGVDGQGVAHGVGQALGLKLLGGCFNQEEITIIDAKVVVIAGDGCLMEGVSHEASSLAGHWKLDNFILIYDRNKTSLDGYVTQTFSEDIQKRYEAYGFDVFFVDGHDLEAIHQVFSSLKQKQNKPVLVVLDTIIGKGLPEQEGSYLVHSNPVGLRDKKMAKERFGFPDQDFFVPEQVYRFFEKRKEQMTQLYEQWNEKFDQWKRKCPNAYELFLNMHESQLPNDLEKRIEEIRIEEICSGRKASGIVLNALSKIVPSLYGGSADLARSDMTFMHDYTSVSADNFTGRNIKYGVREFGMAAIAIGLAQTQMIRPFIGTFLAFSDYMINAIRMASLMRLPVIYQLTHDSVWIGQDGPTHQPIEQLVHLRAIPNLQVIRPCDPHEVKMGWLAALTYEGPTALILSRQNLTNCPGTNKPFEEGLAKGAYIVKNKEQEPDIILIASGSEVFLALQVAEILEKDQWIVRVISMPSWELFEKQDKNYQNSLLKCKKALKVSLEAGSTIGWHKYVQEGVAIGIDVFGYSGRSQDLEHRFAFTAKQIVSKILGYIQPRIST